MSESSPSSSLEQCKRRPARAPADGVVLDEDAGHYGGDRRQELSHDPVFELDEVGAPCLYKRAESRFELRRSSLRRPGRQPSKQRGPDLRTMPGALRLFPSPPAGWAPPRRYCMPRPAQGRCRVPRLLWERGARPRAAPQGARPTERLRGSRRAFRPDEEGTAQQRGCAAGTDAKRQPVARHPDWSPRLVIGSALGEHEAAGPSDRATAGPGCLATPP